MMLAGQDQSSALETMLLAADPSPEALSAQLKLVIASCKDCHVAYRD
jgi:cytochrome c556